MGPSSRLATASEEGGRAIPGLLIVTCGTTDLQFVARSSTGEVVRLAAARRQQRALHEALLDGRLPYLVDPFAEVAEFREDMHVGLSEGQPGIVASRIAPETPALFALDWPLRLVPAKLSGLPTALDGEAAPDTVIVFNTHRDNDPNEPIAAGRILSHWLAEAFGLERTARAGEPRKGAAGWSNFLDGTMLAEGREGAPVNPAAVQRMDDALRGLDGRWKAVTLAITGGLPAYRDQIRALARFRFRRAKIFEFVQPQRQPGRVERLPDGGLPSDSFRLRHEVRARVRRGDFVGAATLARQGWARGQPSWVELVTQAAAYLNGILASTEPLPDFLAALAGPRAPRCLLPAMRVESAIRAHRLPEAVLWTFAFFDAALLDAIANQPYVVSLNDLNSVVDIDETRAAIPGELLATQPRGNPCMFLDDGRAGLPRRGARRYKYQTGGHLNDVWIRNLDPIGPSLKALDGRLSDMGGLQPKRLRNIIAHSALSSVHMIGLRDRFTNLGIWNANVTPGGYFLSQPEVVAIITGLRLPPPAQLHDALVEGLCAAVEDARMR
jgi:hypothetical protein